MIIHRYRKFEAYISQPNRLKIITYKKKNGSWAFRNFDYPGVQVASLILEEMGIYPSDENIQTLLAPTRA